MGLATRFHSWRTSLRGGLAPADAETRAKLFPDFGLRSDSEQLSASFDPFNLAVRESWSEDTEEERGLLREGRISNLQKLARAKMGAMDEAGALDYVFNISNELHELRHFHDHFGTTFGFSRFWAALQDAMRFYRLWSELKPFPVKLPLAKWGEQGDAPIVLKEYLKERRSYVEEFKINDGTMSQDIDFNGTFDKDISKPVEVVVAVSIKGVEAALPGVTLTYTIGSDGDKFQRIYPLGASLIMEGSAFVIQRKFVSDHFGKQFFEGMKKRLMSWEYHDRNTAKYMAVDLFMSKYIPKYYDRYHLALSDIALMSSREKGTSFHDSHPGWRFKRALDAAAKFPGVHRDQRKSIQDYCDMITNELSWPTMREVVEEACGFWNRLRDQLKSHENASFFDLLADKAIGSHLEWLDLRKKFPDILSDPINYTRNYFQFSRPLVWQRRSGLVFPGGSAEASLFRQWFLFEHFQRRLLFSSSLPCPGEGVSPHKCPGDPLRNWIWKPMATCPFSRLVEIMDCRKVLFLPA